MMASRRLWPSHVIRTAILLPSFSRFDWCHGWWIGCVGMVKDWAKRSSPLHLRNIYVCVLACMCKMASDREQLLVLEEIMYPCLLREASPSSSDPFGSKRLHWSWIYDVDTKTGPLDIACAVLYVLVSHALSSFSNHDRVACTMMPFPIL